MSSMNFHILCLFSFIYLQTFTSMFVQAEKIEVSPDIDDIILDEDRHLEEVVVQRVLKASEGPELSGVVGIKSWHRLQVGSILYLLGANTTSLTLVPLKIKLNKNSRYHTVFLRQFTYEFESTIGPIVLIEHTNKVHGSKSGFALVTTEQDNGYQSIEWYNLTKSGAVKFDTWNNEIKGRIIAVKWVRSGDSEYLIVFTQGNGTNTVIDLSKYYFNDSGLVRFRMICVDKLSMEGVPSSVEVFSEGSFLYYIMVLGDETLVYRYHLDSENSTTQTELVQRIRTPASTLCQIFTLSKKWHFLFINGVQANIFLLYPDGKFKPQLKSNDEVEEWLPLEVKSDRGDLLVLGRSRTGLTALSWHGPTAGFRSTHQPPCYLADNDLNQVSVVSRDMSCMLGGGRWSGAAVIDLGESPSVVVSGSPPSLFHLDTILLPRGSLLLTLTHLTVRAQQLLKRLLNLAKEVEKSEVMPAISELSLYNLEMDELERATEKLATSLNNSGKPNNVKLEVSVINGNIAGKASGSVNNYTMNAAFSGHYLMSPIVQKTEDNTHYLLFEGNVKLNEFLQFKMSVSTKIHFDLDENPVDSSPNQLPVSPEVSGPVPAITHQVESPPHEKVAQKLYG